MKLPNNRHQNGLSRPLYTFVKTMNEDEFDNLIDGYIERTATGYGEMPAELFLDLLMERMEARVDETINLSIDVSEADDLVITPDRELSDIVIKGNEILVRKL